MKTVYVSFSTDVVHRGHLNIINQAVKYGKVIAGVFTDKVVCSMDRYPILPLIERIEIIKGLKGVDRVVIQDELSYKNILQKLKPDYVLHGDDWIKNSQTAIRAEVIEVLKEWGGQLIEIPYTVNKELTELEDILSDRLSVPEHRRPRLKNMLKEKNFISVMEAHNGLSALIVEKTVVPADGEIKQFDAMWVSSLCDSSVKGKPDIELVDMTSRLKTIDEIMEVTTKPIILDCDTGGLTEHFVYNIRTLERIGVSAAIIEDKIGLKKNSLFGTDANQTQDSIENFCAKIQAGKKVLRTKDFMLIARIESLILEAGMDDAIKRALAYVKAGADGIMIHSRRKTPDEVFEFCRLFRKDYPSVPIVVVPTTFNTVTEDEFKKAGVNIVIYANHLLRSAFLAMRKVAETILKNSRSEECDSLCLPIKEILNLIPPL
ncbi:MAG: phosphoenolpyruvate mutase [Firmicutes bacterium]|nr:phosphoenolpyruvate mutase [Bacillota bacterium]